MNNNENINQNQNEANMLNNISPQDNNLLQPQFPSEINQQNIILANQSPNEIKNNNPVLQEINNATTPQPFMTSQRDTTLNIEPTDQNNYINNMNVDGSYNKIEKDESLTTAGVTQQIEQKKATIKIGEEAKVFIIIIAIIFIFILVLPMLFDFLNSIKYR